MQTQYLYFSLFAFWGINLFGSQIIPRHHANFVPTAKLLILSGGTFVLNVPNYIALNVPNHPLMATVAGVVTSNICRSYLSY